MSKKFKTGKEEGSAGLLLFIYRRRIPLLSITLLAFVASVIVSLLITPRYRSTVIIYPATFTSLSQTMAAPSVLRPETPAFGREQDVERLLQVLHSETIKRKIIGKYDLMNHYGIDRGDRYPYTTLNKKFEKNVRFSKTEFMAIEIEVLDTDPAIAAAMANDMASYVDSLISVMLRERAAASLAVIEDEYERMQNEVAQLEDSLTRVREMGIINYESQSEVLNNAYATAILEKDTGGIDFFKDKLDMLSRYGGLYVSLRDRLEYQYEKLGELKTVYDQARLDAEAVIPYTYIIDEAGVSEKKAYPVRSLIVVVSTLSAFVLTLFMLLLTDAFQIQVFSRLRHKH